MFQYFITAVKELNTEFVPFIVDRTKFLEPEFVSYLKIDGATDKQIYYRTVNVPTEEVLECKDITSLLDRIYYWGQNDFQPVEFSPSVSVKDVILFLGKKYKVEPVGFSEVV